MNLNKFAYPRPSPIAHITLHMKRILIFYCVLTMGIAGKCQNTPADSLNIIAGNFIRHLRKNPTEKIYLTTDKWFYIAGQRIWFKAYCLNALSNKPTYQSKILFVDLVDEYDNVISQTLLDIRKQRLDGNFALSAFLPEGYYWIRAYTRKLLRENVNRVFVQPIYVLSPQAPNNSALNEKSPVDKKDITKTNQPQVIFYPEGGAIVAGTNSVVAFRSFDANGNPVDISGYVSDNIDSVVTTFKTTIPGLGKLSFEPWKSRKYVVHVKWPDNTQSIYTLPAIDQYAKQLSVTNQTPTLFQVQVSLGDSLYKKNKLTYLLAVSGDSLCFAGIGRDMYQVFIPKERFPQGKATLLLFDERHQIVSERNIYVDRNSNIVSIQADKESYGSREKATLNITLTDSMQIPELSRFSIAVTDDNLTKQVPAEPEDNPLSYTGLQLPAEEKSYSTEEWDLIMLTQKNKFTGWQDESDISDTRTTNIDDDSVFTAINGHVEGAGNTPKPNRIITLVTKQNDLGVFETDTTNNLGRFHFSLPGYDDSTEFLLQVANKKGIKQDEEIIIDSFAFPHFKTPAQSKKRFASTETKVIHDFKAHQLDTTLIGTGKEWLNAVTVKAYKKKEVDYDESKRVSPFSRIITSDMIEQGGIGSVANALLMTPGVHMKNGHLAVTGGAGFREGEPLLVVDGVPIDMSRDTGSQAVFVSTSPLLNYIEQISPAVIDFIEVLTGAEAAIYGTRGAYGVIIINTGTRLKVDNKYARIGLSKIYPKGYAYPSNFISPDYDKKEIKKSITLDERSTIYWNGNMATDYNGKASVSFFTADPKSTYTVTVKGFTARGELIYKQIKIDRK